MKEIDVIFREGLWIATAGDVEAAGTSPDEAVNNLERMGEVTIAKPVDEDWITPDRLPPTKDMSL